MDGKGEGKSPTPGGSWHYINVSFKSDGQSASVQTKPSVAVDILTALAENERIA